MKKFTFRPLACLLAAIAIIGSGSCTPPAANNNSKVIANPGEHTNGQQGGTLTYRVLQTMKTFNYLKVDNETGVIVDFYLLGGRLIDFDGESQHYIPALAESWQLADDARTLNLTLRDNLKFSDGHPLTADDVIFTVKTTYDERVTSPVYRDSILINGKKIEVNAVDQRRLRFVFPEPVASAENYISNIAILPKHKLEADVNAGTLDHDWGMDANTADIVTAGPFTVDSVPSGDRTVLKRNPNYWKSDSAGTRLPYLDSIAIVTVPDMNNSMAQLQQGSIDVVDRIRPGDLVAIRNAGGAVKALDLGPGLNTDHIFFNLNQDSKTGKPGTDPVRAAWFNDVRFRKAIATAVDRQSIAVSSLQGLATPLYGIVSPGNKVWFATDLPKTEFDLDKAKSMFKDAGFVTRGTADAPELFDAKGNRVEFTLLVQAENQLRQTMAAVVQADLARAGVKMNIAPVDTVQLNEKVRQGTDYDAALLGTSTTQPDPSSYESFVRSDGTNHQWRPRQEKPASDWEARLDELDTAESRETNEDRRRSIFHDIQAIVVDEQPIIPIVARHVVVAANSRIGNYRPGVLLPYSLWNVDELFIRK